MSDSWNETIRSSPGSGELRRELEHSRARILDARKELDQIEDRLDALPGLEETLKRYQDAGIEEDLKEQSLLVREERLLDTIPERLQPFRSCRNELRQELPIDRTFLSQKALEDLPGKEILASADHMLERLNSDLEAVLQGFDSALDKFDQGVPKNSRAVQRTKGHGAGRVRKEAPRTPKEPHRW